MACIIPSSARVSSADRSDRLEIHARKSHAAVQPIGRCAWRIKNLCQDVQDFARLDTGDLTEADLNDGVRSAVNIINGLAKEQQVTLEADLAALPCVLCASGRVNQVILNLLANAIDACPTGGSVTRCAPGLPRGSRAARARHGTRDRAGDPGPDL